MNITLILAQIQCCFKSHHSQADKRAKIQSLEFISALVLGFVKDNHRRTLATLRRNVVDLTGKALGRSTFWERMATPKLNALLSRLLHSLLTQVCVTVGVQTSILSALKVKRVFLLDSTSCTLPEGAKKQFPSPRSAVIPASIKAHLLFDLLGGNCRWFDLSPATVHDRKGFPSFPLLAGSLIIFDLGYWDGNLFKDLHEAGVFFLTRVKSNAKLRIIEVISGLPVTCVGYGIHSALVEMNRGDIVEAKAEFALEGFTSFSARVVGFWNSKEQKYHWYATNLSTSAKLLYPLYRLRWQLELFWKGWKGCFHLDEISTSHTTIIKNLMLLGLITGLIAGSIAVSVLSTQPKEIQAARSVQRACFAICHLDHELFNFICHISKNTKNALFEKLQLFLSELYDPNYQRRPTSVQRVFASLAPT